MRFVTWFSALPLLAACSGAPDLDESADDAVGETGSTLVTNNRIALNRIALNRIALNRIALNRIALNRIALNRIALNRIALNRIALNRIALNRIALNRIALNRIALNRLQLDASAAGNLITTEEGRELLRYVTECALPAGTTLVARQGNTDYEFDGAIGLAPKWIARPLDGTDQRWISACLLARVNAHDVSVQISLRGDHPALRVDDDEMATFSLEEGAFWGNVFEDEEDYNACRGTDQAAGETGDLVDRDCTEPDPAKPGFTLCGFEYSGACGGDGRRDACSDHDDEGTFYERCEGPGRRDRRYREVITTFVQP